MRRNQEFVGEFNHLYSAENESHESVMRDFFNLVLTDEEQ